MALSIAKSTNENTKHYVVEVVKGQGHFTDALKEEMLNNRIEYFCSPINSNKPAILFFPFWFIFIVFRVKPQIIHSHTEIPDLSVFIFHQLFGRWFKQLKYVRTIHNTELWTSWKWIGRIVEKFFQRTKANVSISKAVQERYELEFGQLTPIIYNGLSPVEPKQFPDIVQHKINILFAGRFETQKGIDVLISVIKDLSKDDRLFFHVIGDGTLKQHLYEELDSLPNVRFYGKTYGLASYLSSFDFLFMPSHFEGLGLMSVEASLAHVPTIINACPGLEETLPDDWPLKVCDNRVSDYIQIFETELTKLNKNELGDVAFNYVNEHFSLPIMQSLYEKRYQSICEVAS